MAFPPPLQILISDSTKAQLKSLVKDKISLYWWDQLAAQCLKYSSLAHFNYDRSKYGRPHPIVSLSGSSNFLNYKAPLALKMLCGRYRSNQLKSKFNPSISPICKLCNMSAIDDLTHIILICPYLDGARSYALLLWANKTDKSTYNLFHSALKLWPDHKLLCLFLDPSSQLSYISLKAHPRNFLENSINFAQDYLYSIDRQRHLFHGDNSTTPPIY